jgi:hypothetical protein
MGGCLFVCLLVCLCVCVFVCLCVCVFVCLLFVSVTSDECVPVAGGWWLCGVVAGVVAFWVLKFKKAFPKGAEGWRKSIVQKQGNGHDRFYRAVTLQGVIDRARIAHASREHEAVGRHAPGVATKLRESY